MKKKIFALGLALIFVFLIGCGKTDSTENKGSDSIETGVTASVNNDEPDSSSALEEPSATSTSETEAGAADQEAFDAEEPDYEAIWAELPWPVKKIERTILYATTTVNLRDEPHKKSTVLKTIEYNDEVMAIGLVENYFGDKLDFYLLETGEYACTDYFEAFVNVPDLGEGGYVYYGEDIYTYDNLVEDILKLAEAYPDRFSYEAIGNSVDGRDIYALQIGKPSDKCFLIMATIHADEYINTPLCMEQIDMYLQKYDEEYKKGVTYGDILDACNLVYIPCVNPDGMSLVQFGIDGIQNEEVQEKIKKIGFKGFWTANANGVDLNRNWDSSWNNEKAEHSTKPAPALYPGKKAFSEPETTAIKDWVGAHKELCGVVSFHNQGRVVYWYSNQTKKSTAYKKCKEWSKILADITDYALEKEDKVIVRGMEYNWFNLKKKIPCIQIETGRGENPLPYKEWRTIWRDNKYVGIEMAYQNR